MIKKFIVLILVAMSLSVSTCVIVSRPIVVSKSPDGIILRYHKVTRADISIYNRDQMMDLVAEQHCGSAGKFFVQIFSDTRNAAFVTYTYVCRLEPGPHSPL